MPHNIGLAAFSKFLVLHIFCLSFFHSPLLALHLDIPTRSSDGKTIFFTWAENDGDLTAVYMQVMCEPVSLPRTSKLVQVSDQKLSFEGDPQETIPASTVNCTLYAFEGPHPEDKVITKSDTFTTFAEAPIEEKSSSVTPGGSPIPRPTLDPSPTEIIAPLTSSSAQFEPVLTVISPTMSVIPVATTQPLTPTGSPAPISTSVGNGKENRFPTSSRADVIVGVIGGLTLVALLGFLYLQRRRIRKLHIGLLRPTTSNPEIGLPRNIRSLFRNHNTLEITSDPLIVSEDYQQPEGKRERFLRAQQEMSDAQRQREVLRSNLSSYNRRNAINEGVQHDLEGGEIKEILRQALERITGRIQELEARLTEMAELPPDYHTSTNHA